MNGLNYFLDIAAEQVQQTVAQQQQTIVQQAAEIERLKASVAELVAARAASDDTDDKPTLTEVK